MYKSRLQVTGVTGRGRGLGEREYGAGEALKDIDNTGIGIDGE